MNNSVADQILSDCDADLQDALNLIGKYGVFHDIVPYLNKYGIIRACGSIEVAFKTIIADYCDDGSKQQVINFVNAKIRENPANPRYDKICQILKSVDEDWNNEFKTKVKSQSNKTQILFGINSLVDARNDFAHGGNPNVSLNDTYTYFTESKKLIDILDSVVS